jgi:SAM-dependent methyltransferase
MTAPTLTSVDYYQLHADEFYERTVGVRIPHLYEPFLELIPPGGRILDIGCGSGRDSLHFSQCGYEVTAVDPSPAMRERASRLIGKPVLPGSFEDLVYKNAFHGVWACASLLHVSRQEMTRVIKRLTDALKINGALYASFKARDADWIEDGRHFTGYTKAALSTLFAASPELEILNIWESEDVGRAGQFWANALACRRS